MRNSALLIIIVTLLILSGCAEELAINRQKPMRLVHDVYFTLNDNSDVAQAKLVRDCYKYLSKHPGVVFFAAGGRVEEHERDVNICDWDIGLHIVFENKDYHDQYQKAPDHYKFIEENKENWKSVRVFDSFIK
ncbi:MAG: Dabb family protein [Planctomycetota bacterium]